jgi:hypothetical protein
MTPERWREVEQVYQSTVDREPQLRAAYLAEACGDDQELRREVDSLLELNQLPPDVSAAGNSPPSNSATSLISARF